jgi:hypothetical protein
MGISDLRLRMPDWLAVRGHPQFAIANPQWSGSGRSGLLWSVELGLQTSDVLAVGAEEMWLLNLTGLLAQTELKELLASLAKLGGDLGGREFADFFSGHGGRQVV